MDTGMNSVLAEFNITLLERYDLLYVDTSYSGKKPSVSNMESRLAFYMNHNLKNPSEEAPWGNVNLNRVTISEIVTAAAGNGKSMKYQAAKYIKDAGIEREEGEIFAYLGAAANLDGEDIMEEWCALQEQIAGIELPRILNEEGEWEEVPLGNPADRIFGLAGSDIFYLLNMNMENIGVGSIQKSAYISGRNIENKAGTVERQADDRLFLIYLFEKMGNYRKIKEDSFLKYQLEYIAEGGNSDYENLQAVIGRLVRWRFAVNVSCIMGNGNMYGEALEIADSLYAVQLKEEFREPVTRSILYACAYLETISEVRCLLSGGRVEMEKSGWHTGIEQVLAGEIPSEASGDSGLSYEQYLACMVMLLSEDARNLRSMDIMEMDIRYLTGNSDFAMDWCVERYQAEIQAEGAMGDSYEIRRTYGYF
ncbi:MAG: DUF5702 domain-containing protein [Suilimivivens sp.]